eukprot:gene23026-30218_t
MLTSKASTSAVSVRRNPARVRNSNLVARFGPVEGSMATVELVSQVATVGLLGIGAVLVYDMQQKESTSNRRDEKDNETEPCPRCEGSGYESCMCSRWSDGDAGCSTCSKTGYMACRSCRGGGTAIPLLVPVRKTNNFSNGGNRGSGY